MIVAGTRQRAVDSFVAPTSVGIAIPIRNGMQAEATPTGRAAGGNEIGR